MTILQAVPGLRVCRAKTAGSRLAEVRDRLNRDVFVRATTNGGYAEVLAGREKLGLEPGKLVR